MSSKVPALVAEVLESPEIEACYGDLLYVHENCEARHMKRVNLSYRMWM